MLIADKIAVVFLAVALFLILYLELPLRQTQAIGNHFRQIWKCWDQDQQSSNYNKNPATNKRPEGTEPNSSLIQPATEEYQHNAEERRFWERQIRVALWLNKVTGAAAFAAIIGLILIYIQVRDAEFATEEANRAWVRPDPGQAIFVKRGTAAIIQGAINITNIGREPASDVQTVLKEVWVTPPNNLFEQRSMDMRMLRYPVNNTCEQPEGRGYLGSMWPSTAARGVTGEDMPLFPGFDNADVLFAIQGCVIYKTFDKIHYSRFCFVLTPRDIPVRNNYYWSDCQGEGQQWAD